MRLLLALHRLQRRGGVRIGVKLQVKRHQFIAQARIVDLQSLQRIVQRIAGHMPEIRMHPHEAAEPGVFQLLLPPQRSKARGLLANLGCQLLHRRTHIKQRAIGIKNAGPYAFQSSHCPSPSRNLRLC